MGALARTVSAMKKLAQRKPSKAAAGFKAITTVMKFGLTQPGAINTVRTALKINQVNGFDCQSCAWPNPDNDRSVAEFCENGFKAVAYEATKKRIDRGFFRDHAVSELAKQPEYWLGDQGRLTEPMVLRAGSDHYEPIEWEAVFQLIAGELKSLASPDEATFTLGPGEQ